MGVKVIFQRFFQFTCDIIILPLPLLDLHQLCLMTGFGVRVGWGVDRI